MNRSTVSAGADTSHGTETVGGSRVHGKHHVLADRRFRLRYATESPKDRITDSSWRIRDLKCVECVLIALDKKTRQTD